MKKTFIKELLKRRIPQIIGSYLIASTSMILFLDWIKINYSFPQQYITLALFGALSILPSVIILAYFHGAPGKDEWTQRDMHVHKIRCEGVETWRRDSGYYRQSGVENTFYRYKTIIGRRLRARGEEARHVEAAIACKILNGFLELGGAESELVV